MDNNFWWLLQLNYWQSFLSVIFIIFAFILIYLIFKKKSFNFKIIIAFIIGFVGAIIFSQITNFYYDPSIDNLNNWYYEVKNWLVIPISLYLSLVLFFFPFYLFFSLTKLFFSSSKINYTLIFFNLINIIIGFSIALLFFPFLKYITFSIGEPFLDFSNSPTSILEIFSFLIPSSILIFSSFWLIIPILIFSICLGYSIKKYKNKNEKNYFKLNAFFESGKFIIDYIFNKIVIMIPLIIATFIPLIFSGNSLLSIHNFVFLFFIFLIGALVIYLIQTTFIKFKNKHPNSLKEIFKINLNSIFVGSNASLSYIEQNFNYLTTNSQKFSLYLSSSSSQAMSAGFSSTIIYLLYLINTPSSFNFLTIFILFLIVVFGSFLISGFWGSDYMVNSIILNSFGFQLGFISSTLLPIELFLRPIKNIVDTNGILMNVNLLINQKIEYKRSI